jgi:hypothetical protein
MRRSILVTTSILLIAGLHQFSAEAQYGDGGVGGFDPCGSSTVCKANPCGRNSACVPKLDQATKSCVASCTPAGASSDCSTSTACQVKACSRGQTCVVTKTASGTCQAGCVGPKSSGGGTTNTKTYKSTATGKEGFTTTYQGSGGSGMGSSGGSGKTIKTTCLRCPTYTTRTGTRSPKTTSRSAAQKKRVDQR